MSACKCQKPAGADRCAVCPYAGPKRPEWAEGHGWSHSEYLRERDRRMAEYRRAHNQRVRVATQCGSYDAANHERLTARFITEAQQLDLGV